MDFVVETYRLTSNFPASETYGLTGQVRRAAVSIPSNIAEGHGRAQTREYVRFLGIAYGSLCECQTQLLLSERLGYLERRQTQYLLQESGEIGKMLHGLIRSLSDEKSRSKNSPTDP